MFQFWFNRIILLHAGTSPVVSQTVLTLMLVVLGIVLVGIGFGYLVKTKESLLEHRWMLSGSIVLTAGAILLVMLPTFFRFYLDPDVQVFSGLSITTLIHGLVGAPAITAAVFYALGKLPKNIKKWMKWTGVLWVASITLGVFLFLQMMGLLPATSGM
jgi:MFS family permease